MRQGIGENRNRPRFVLCPATTHGATLPVDSVGLSVGDVDGNGTLDLFLHGTSTRLLRNNGLGVFTDLTATHLPGATGPHLDDTLADVDTDSNLDLIITAGAGGVRLWRNDGTGHFTDVTNPAIPDLTVFAIAVAPGDVDGHLDNVAALATTLRIHSPVPARRPDCAAHRRPGRVYAVSARDLHCRGYRAGSQRQHWDGQYHVCGAGHSRYALF